MQTWDLRALDVQARQPQVLTSGGEGRAIVLDLPGGEMLQEHQVHEGAWLLVARGEVEIATPDGETVGGGEGFFAYFDPKERHEVRAKVDTRLLLILTPWPGDGHPSQTA